MKIEFINSKNGTVIREGDPDFWVYFVFQNEVYRDNGFFFESQSAVLSFDDFIERVPHFTWKVVDE